MDIEVYNTNIEKETLENTDYRRVVFTGKKIQLVLMSLGPNEEIPKEVHHDIDQFIRIESGNAIANVAGKSYELKDDDCIIIPAETEHQIINSSSGNSLKLYSIYAEPEHAPGTVHKTKDDADSAEHHH